MRSFQVPATIAEEMPGRSVNREYGVNLPATVGASDERLPLTTFLHGSSGAPDATNHLYASVMPGLTRDFGERLGGIVVFPKDRQIPGRDAYYGSPDTPGVFAGWWVADSLMELQEVWKDAIATFDVDEDRQYLTGYSMGGIAAYVLPALMPDRFAAVHVIAGIVMDDQHYPGLGYPFQTFVGSAEFSVLRVIPNLRHVPVSIFAGAADMNTPWAENVEPVRQLHELGYRHRFYTFPWEHFGHGVMDEWAEASRYLADAERVRHPARVVHVRDMVVEQQVERGIWREPVDSGAEFSFDHAFWVRELVAADDESGRATIDARSLAVSEPPYRTRLEVGGPTAPGQTGPYVMEGLAWETAESPTTPQNSFTASLSGATSVRLELGEMLISSGEAITAEVEADREVRLRLHGDWDVAPAVTVNGATIDASLIDGLLEIPLGSGSNDLAIRPSGGPADRGASSEQSGPTLTASDRGVADRAPQREGGRAVAVAAAGTAGEQPAGGRVLDSLAADVAGRGPSRTGRGLLLAGMAGTFGVVGFTAWRRWTPARHNLRQ